MRTLQIYFFIFDYCNCNFFVIGWNVVIYIHIHIYCIYLANDGSSSIACLHHACDGICVLGGTGRRSNDELT
jgi:hypothetical protein